MSSAGLSSYKIEAISTQGTVIFCREMFGGAQTEPHMFVKDARSDLAYLMDDHQYVDYLDSLSMHASQQLELVQSTLEEVTQQKGIVASVNIREAIRSFASQDSWIDLDDYRGNEFSSYEELISFVRENFGIQIIEVAHTFQPGASSRLVA